MELKGAFVAIQVLLVVAFIVAWRWLRAPGVSSQFKDDEGGGHIPDPFRKIPSDQDRLAHSKLNPKKTKRTPLSLPGIVINGKPHEVLGVSPSATEKEIQRAYRDLMKRFHPDKLGPPGSQTWKDGEAIADAINRAKVEMLRQRKNFH